MRSEGIDAELRGPVDGPYALTVGDLARVDVYVPADQMDDAQLVVLAAEVDADPGGTERVERQEEDPEPVGTGRRRGRAPGRRDRADRAVRPARLTFSCSAGQHAAELVALDAPERATGRTPLEHGHLELFGRQRLAVVLAEHRRAEA